MNKTIAILLRKYWKHILIAVVAILLAFAAISIFKGASRYINDYNSLKAAYEALDEREQSSIKKISEQKALIDIKDKMIDSLDVALSLKRTKLIKIESDVQLLKGDSVAIVDNLARVFAREAYNRNLQQSN